MATQTFTESSTRYEAAPITYNGQKRILWTMRKLENNAWVYHGQAALPPQATKRQISAHFENHI
jgi:hypothetical protein